MDSELDPVPLARILATRTRHHLNCFYVQIPSEASIYVIVISKSPEIHEISQTDFVREISI
jgi:hypothetical protein